MTNKNIKVKQNQKRRNTSQNKKNVKFNTDTLICIALVILMLILGIKLLGVKTGIIFTLILFGGIALILFLSKIIGKIGKNKKSRKIINVIVIILLVLCIAGCVGVCSFFLYIVEKAPEFDEKQLVYSESTLLYDKDNKLVTELGAKKRENITYDEMSEVLIDAMIATEDSRFFQHNGFDAARFLKASFGQVINKLLHRSSNAGGASTLSMQVVKNSFTSKEAEGWEGIVRKFTDIYLSVFKLEKNYTKQEIIEFYANNHFLGANSYGVEQAARTYFGKHASELNLAEASLIVGIFKAPTSYNPFNYPEAATARRKTVLNLMYYHGYITKEERDLANSIPVKSLLVKSNDNTSEYQGYIDTVVAEIEKKWKVNPYNTPLIIYTNMDTKKQAEVNKIFTGETFKWENDYIQAGIAAVDVHNGKIIAIGNGRNRNGASTYNFATDINRQIGSSAKPVIDYAPGMEFLNWSTYQIFDDSKHYYSSGQEIRDADRRYMGNITLRTALAQSRNIPALKAFQAVMKEIGSEKYKEFVQSFGIKTENYLHEAHAIGSFNGSNPLTMASAYAVFANGGYYYEPYSVNKIVFRNTGEAVEYKSEGKQVISDSTAFMITDVLVSAVQNGLSSGARINGYNIAAKTGTTNYDEAAIKATGVPRNAIPDAWLIGYNSDVSIGVWYGCELPSKTKYLTQNSGIIYRGKLFRAVAQIAMNKGTTFEVPNSVVKVGIEKGSNPAKLASSSTPSDNIVYEYFKKGTEPTEVSIKYSKLPNVTGLTGEYNASDLSFTLNWSAIKLENPANETEYGKLGYKIYKDNKLIKFTTDTSYTFLNVTDPRGTYKVVTTYKNFSDNESTGAIYKYVVNSENVFTAKLKYQSSSYENGDTLATFDKSPSSADITVHLNGEDITAKSNITVTITDPNGNVVTTVDNNVIGTFTIKYNVKYETHSEELIRTITISEKS